jgi:hypothetical protein
MGYGRLTPGEENSAKLVSWMREQAISVASANNFDTIIMK